MEKKHNSPKIELAGNGLGIASPADVEQRARELATIADRATVTDEDRRQARAQFQDRDLPETVNEDADSTQSLSRDPSDPLADRGHQVPEYGMADEKADLERLALEGVEEAQHEQMLQARNLVDKPLGSPRKRDP